MNVRQSDLDKENGLSILFLFISIINFSGLCFLIVNLFLNNQSYNYPLIIIALFFSSILFSLLSIKRILNYKKLFNQYKSEQELEFL